MRKAHNFQQQNEEI